MQVQWPDQKPAGGPSAFPSKKWEKHVLGPDQGVNASILGASVVRLLQCSHVCLALLVRCKGLCKLDDGHEFPGGAAIPVLLQIQNKLAHQCLSRGAANARSHTAHDFNAVGEGSGAYRNSRQVTLRVRRQRQGGAFQQHDRTPLEQPHFAEIHTSCHQHGSHFR